MKFVGKEFSHYWKIIRVPTYVLIGWSILSFIIGAVSISLYFIIFSTLPNLLLSIAIFTFIGWTTIKDHKEGVGIAAWAGALTGVISGFIGAIIGVLMFYLLPNLIQATLQQAGADVAAVKGFLEIGVYIGLITGPLISGLLGAAIAAIVALIAKKI